MKHGDKWCVLYKNKRHHPYSLYGVYDWWIVAFAVGFYVALMMFPGLDVYPDGVILEKR